MFKKHTHTRLITKHHFIPKFVHKKKTHHQRYEQQQPSLKLKLISNYEDTDTAGSWNYDSKPWETKLNQHFVPGKKNIDWSLMRAAFDSNYEDVEIPKNSHKFKKTEYEPQYSEGDYTELKYNPNIVKQKNKNKYKINSDYHQGDVYAPMPSSDYNHFHGYINDKQSQDEDEEEETNHQQFQEQKQNYHIDSPITYNQWPNSQNINSEDSYQNWGRRGGGGGEGTTTGINSYRTLPTVDEMDEILKYENYERSLKKVNNNNSNIYKIVKNNVKPKSQRHTTIISQSY